MSMGERGREEERERERKNERKRETNEYVRDRETSHSENTISL